MWVDSTTSGVTPGRAGYTLNRSSLPHPGVEISGCSTAMRSTAYCSPARNSWRNAPARPSQYVVDSISTSCRVNAMGSIAIVTEYGTLRFWLENELPISDPFHVPDKREIMIQLN